MPAAATQTVNLYGRLRAAILNLDLLPGEKLTERGLESRLGASRTPIRAALMQLATDGLVQRDNRGWMVTPIDLGEIQAIAEFREALETAAVRLAVQRVSDEDIDAMVELLLSARKTSDEDSGVRAGDDFHTMLARLAGNELMAEAVHGAMTRLDRTRWLEVRTTASRDLAWNEHRAILEALRQRDADTAARLVAEHIRDTNTRLLAFLTGERLRLRGSGLAIVE